MKHELTDELWASVSSSLHEWQQQDKLSRLWSGDATLWTGTDEGRWLGWLRAVEDAAGQIERWTRFADEVKRSKPAHVLVLGMGGSSLFPEVLAMTFGKLPDHPELLVLDSTDPAQVASFERRIDLARTLFVVSSKSGSTLEPNIFKDYFFERVRKQLGAEEAGKRFTAITDPGSKLQRTAESDQFRHIFSGMPSIGGRYSALSSFGMVPAAAMGVDVPRFLQRAKEMARRCSDRVPLNENPGVLLGSILGVLGRQGRDKVTLVASPGVRDFGAWLEQLLAESTGKKGKGLIPVDGESLATPDRYGNDRLFVYIRLASAPDPSQDKAIDALARAGQPVVRIEMEDPYDLGAEVFRWEMATAVAGSILGINPFDQPDVEASKVETQKLTAEFESSGTLPPERPFLESEGLRLFADSANAAMLSTSARGSAQVCLQAHLDRLQGGDYFALLAYVEMNPRHREILESIRDCIRDQKKVATCLGFGPRFLHSTGQAYKGGPNTGVFLQLTADDALDLPVPGRKYTFGVVKSAQARGDFQVLSERGRRALRVHLGKDVPGALQILSALISGARK